MKKLLVNLLKGLLVVILFTGTSVLLFSTADVKTVNEAQANVNETQVIDYLEECGYKVVACSPKPNTVSDWTARVVSGNNRQYNVIVHVSGDEIVGYEILGNEIIGHEILPF
jgi:hypothetical protein